MKNASTSGYDKSRISCLLTRICTRPERSGLAGVQLNQDEPVLELLIHEPESAAHANHLSESAAGPVCSPAVSRRTAGRTAKASLIYPGQTLEKADRHAATARVEREIQFRLCVVRADLA